VKGESTSKETWPAKTRQIGPFLISRQDMSRWVLANIWVRSLSPFSKKFESSHTSRYGLFLAKAKFATRISSQTNTMPILKHERGNPIGPLTETLCCSDNSKQTPQKESVARGLRPSVIADVISSATSSKRLCTKLE
jgi:hypothetical protein